MDFYHRAKVFLFKMYLYIRYGIFRDNIILLYTSYNVILTAVMFGIALILKKVLLSRVIPVALTPEEIDELNERHFVNELDEYSVKISRYYRLSMLGILAFNQIALLLCVKVFSYFHFLVLLYLPIADLIIILIISIIFSNLFRKKNIAFNSKLMAFKMEYSAKVIKTQMEEKNIQSNDPGITEGKAMLEEITKKQLEANTFQNDFKPM